MNPYHTEDFILAEVYKLAEPWLQALLKKGLDKIFYKALRTYGSDMVKTARNRPPVIGRDEEIRELIQIMTTMNTKCPLVIGKAGVGKTAVVEGLAQWISRGDVPEDLLNVKLISLNMSAVKAGATLLGQYEERVKNIFYEAEQSKGKVILFIDEIHQLKSDAQHITAAEMLKPMLSRGHLTCIGATTSMEYRRHVETDLAFARRFVTVKVKEPTVPVTITILRGIKPKYEKYFKFRISDAALVDAANLSSRFISDRVLPDKAIVVLDRACANLKFNKTRGKGDMLPELGPDHIAEVVTELTGIPVSLVAGAKQKLLGLCDSLREQVVGQDEAIEAVGKAIARFRFGYTGLEQPYGSFLFLGPSGVGKTELAKALAGHLFGTESAFVRIDMSEYMEKHSVARFLGSPPGYIGHDEGGQLTEAVRENPHSLVLLDEVEKAHIDVLNILLQLLDVGTLTDGKGQKVNFKSTIVILTSNLGAEHFLAAQMLKTSMEAAREKAMTEVKKFFSPELLNRFENILVFYPLSQEQQRQVARLEMKYMVKRLAELGVALEMTDAAVDYVMAESYNPVSGGRGVKTFLRDEVVSEVAQMFLRDEVDKNSIVYLDAGKDGFTYRVEKTEGMVDHVMEERSGCADPGSKRN